MRVLPGGGPVRAELAAAAPRAVAAGAASVAVLAVLAFLAHAAGHRRVEFLDSPPTQAAALGLLLAMTLAACGRRRWPATTFVLTATGTAALMLVLGDRSMGASPLYWFAIVSLSTRVGGARLAALAAFGMAADLSAGLALDLAAAHASGGAPGAGAGEVASMLVAPGVNILLGYGLFTAVGKAVARNRRQKTRSAQALARLDREREAKVGEAVAAERATMARELHDVAAHHLTGLIIQAKAANKVFTTSPEHAHRLLPDIAEQGERALTGLRQIVGLLRLHEPGPHTPQPQVADLPALASGCRARSLPVDLAVEAGLDRLGDAVQLACYRIAQEALSNAERHAPGGAAAVELRRGRAGTVRLTVTNTSGGPPAGPGGQGLGLVGMRERAVLLGGTLHAGPDGAGGWRVEAALPAEGRIAQ